METYFTIKQVSLKAFVGFMLMKILPRHLNENKQYQLLDYLAFREKQIEVFEKLDLATAYLNAIASLSQTRDKFISDYMHPQGSLYLRLTPILRTLLESELWLQFVLGLYDRQLASSFDVVKI